MRGRREVSWRSGPMLIVVSVVGTVMFGVLGGVFLHGWFGVPLWISVAIGSLAGLFPVVTEVVRHVR